jgi:anhydro-N-acetylmuramic acid kinase
MLTIIGLMSGTSADGIDAVLVRSDGRCECSPLATHFVPYQDSTRHQIVQARTHPETYLADSNRCYALTQAITDEHISVINHFIKNSSEKIDLIGFHGQTIYHNPQIKRTIQLGDGTRVARDTGVDVIYDFRQADMAAGGQGAPLAPIYHQFLVRRNIIAQPAVILNIGGVANLTYVDEDRLLGYDIGPGNGLMDAFVERRTGNAFDVDGQLAGQGQSDPLFISTALKDPFFAQTGPKSLDWGHFSPLLEAVATKSLKDGLASLCALSAVAVLHAITALPRLPKTLIIAGGGQHNKTLVQAITAGLPPGCTLIEGADCGIEADMLEAELIAFLAARHHFGQVSTFPDTTGVTSPQVAGVRASAQNQN